MFALEQQVAEQVAKMLSWSSKTRQALQVSDIVLWYLTVPSTSTYRVNSLLHTVEEVKQLLTEELTRKLKNNNVPIPHIQAHNIVSECIIIRTLAPKFLDLNPKLEKVIVDPSVGAPVLRGSDVFAPGILGMPSSIQSGTEVSVYVDLMKTCLRGYKQNYEGEKLFIGNGIAVMNRYQIFDQNSKGVAVKMTFAVSGIVTPDCPKEYAILQNLPSIVCVQVLDPKPGETVLDMCAAPGNKTSHIAALMNDQGKLIALDKPSRTQLIHETCSALGIRHCVQVFAANSKNIVGEDERALTLGPPFARQSFDRVLLDACCSGSGNRPIFKITVSTEKGLKSICKVQRAFFYNAIPLLKIGGTLVYSTCSILSEENEEQVAWALKTFHEIVLVKAEPYFGAPGFANCGLTDEERLMVQRFGVGTLAEDTIGFFIAKFIKI